MPLTHFDEQGDARMVDVSGKPATDRIAVARNWIRMRPETLALIEEGRARKGDVTGVARLAGIMAAKKTSDLIPLCHPLPIAKAEIGIEVDRDLPGLRLTATVKTTGQTGVEMEALTAASVAALTVYDMVKAVDRSMEIGGLHVALKDGGKSGRHEFEPGDA
jgi:cyclic pyranopterin phosphate synthase